MLDPEDIEIGLHSHKNSTSKHDGEHFDVLKEAAESQS